MADKTDIKPETLPDLDDLLQCPVCYEIPTGQIFQCNQGHHVCGRCKSRLVECPVCRDLFFGTRNYAMEELISNVRKLRAFKLGGKVTVGTAIDDNCQSVDNAAKESDNNTGDDEDTNDNSSQSSQRAPPACKGLFRCLCCKNGNAERLPVARMLNHLRYFHSPLLIEGSSENGQYLQAWQFPTAPGRIVTAIRISDMGIFFLIIEINYDSVCSWLSMLAAPWVAHEFCYTVTISGSDREAIFSDCVWSVRSCEGSLKKRGHCLIVSGLDAEAMTTPENINAKISIRRTPADQLINQSQPRAVLRVADRGAPENHNYPADDVLAPLIQDLQINVVSISREYVSRSRARRNDQRLRNEIMRDMPSVDANEVLDTRAGEFDTSQPEPVVINQPSNSENMSRNARRRMRQRLRAALNEVVDTTLQNNDQTVNQAQRQNGHVLNNIEHNHTRESPVISEPMVVHIPSVFQVVEIPQPSTANAANTNSQNQSSTRRNKRKRRQRR